MKNHVLLSVPFLFSIRFLKLMNLMRTFHGSNMPAGLTLLPAAIIAVIVSARLARENLDDLPRYFFFAFAGLLFVFDALIRFFGWRKIVGRYRQETVLTRQGPIQRPRNTTSEIMEAIFNSEAGAAYFYVPQWLVAFVIALLALAYRSGWFDGLLNSN
jgi:hypothetical protein